MLTDVKYKWVCKGTREEAKAAVIENVEKSKNAEPRDA